MKLIDLHNAIVTTAQESSITYRKTIVDEKSKTLTLLKFAAQVFRSEERSEQNKILNLCLLFEGFYRALSSQQLSWNKYLKLRNLIWNNFPGAVPPPKFQHFFESNILAAKNLFQKKETESGDEISWMIQRDEFGKMEVYLSEPIAKTEKLQKPEDVDSKFIPTMNRQGFQTIFRDEITEEYMQFLREVDGTGLEVGCAYGVAAPTLAKDNIRIWCNDIDAKHLIILEQDLDEDSKKNVTLVAGAFPYEVDFHEAMFDAILVSRVMHFFDGETINDALDVLHKWLKPGGKLFLINETPYLGNWQPFIPVFEERKANGEQWPGLIQGDEKYKYETAGFSKNLPDINHWQDADTVEKMLADRSFEVIKVIYIDRKNSFPEKVLLDGRESVGAVARIK